MTSTVAQWEAKGRISSVDRESSQGLGWTGPYLGREFPVEMRVNLRDPSTDLIGTVRRTLKSVGMLHMAKSDHISLWGTLQNLHYRKCSLDM